MRKKVVNKLMVNWAASFLSVVILLSMVATPALAVVAINLVNSSSIVDGSIQTRDIKKNAITTSRIANYSIRKEDIHSGSINKYKLTSNSVNTFKIEDGSVENQDMADSSVDSAKIADGAVGSADIADDSITNTDIADGASISDEKISYSTKTKAFSIVGAAFRPEDSGDTFDTLNTDGSLYSLTSGDSYFFAPVHLPDGATVASFRLNVIDIDATYDLQARLYRRSLNNSVTVMAETTSSGSSGTWQNYVENTIDEPIIDNFNYQYFVRVKVRPGTMYVGGASVTYTVTAP